MPNKIKNILNIKVSVYYIIYSVLLIFMLYFIFIAPAINRQRKEIWKRQWLKHKQEAYWLNGNIREEGYYDNGKRIGKWYYYNQDGCLTFVDDMLQIGRKYNVDKREHSGYGAPREVSYILNNQDEKIVTGEFYGCSGDLETLIIYIPSQKIHVEVLYDKNRHITDVKYDISK